MLEQDRWRRHEPDAETGFDLTILPTRRPLTSEMVRERCRPPEDIVPLGGERLGNQPKAVRPPPFAGKRSVRVQQPDAHRDSRRRPGSD